MLEKSESPETRDSSSRQAHILPSFSFLRFHLSQCPPRGTQGHPFSNTLPYPYSPQEG